jgi:predicted dehydrogenase
MPSNIDPGYDYASEYGGHDQGIAVVGCGAIVEAAHLPAYADADFDVVGVYDQDHERASDVAAGSEHDLTVYEDLAELLDDDRVEVVDVAVPPMYQRDIVEQVVDAGRHVLCQKPLSTELAEAREIVDIVEDADVAAAVNQQMRWEKSIRTVKRLIDAGQLGTPLRGNIEVNIDTDWSAWGWMVDSPRLEVMYHSVHYLDAMRYLFGDPERVRSVMARAPDQLPEGETRTIHLLEYADDLRASVDTNHNNWADGYAEFRFEGTEATVRGTIGLFDNYPESGPDEFEYRDGPDADWESFHVERAWFPDAFIGTMGSLLESVESGETAPTHPSDNIHTLELVNATYRSADEGVAVDPSTVTDDYVYD